MDLVYTSVKTVHVIAAIVWLGGLVGTAIIDARIAAEGDAASTAAMARASRFYRSRVVGPAAGLTLLAGFALVITGGLQMRSLWIMWGVVGLVISMTLGATVIRRTGDELTAVSTTDAADARIGTLQRRMRGLNALNLLVLFSVVVAMVVKPTL